MKTIKELLDTRYELRRPTLQAVVTSMPLDADGKSKGYVVATVAGYANEHVLIGPNDTYYVGDAIIVEQIGSPGMAYYRAQGVTTSTRRGATGFYSFTGSTTLSGSTYQAGDIVLGDPASAHGVFTSASIGFKYAGSLLTLWNPSGMNFPNQIKVDTISEYTTASGVTVDSVVLKDGTVDLNGVADALIIDADSDTSISAPTDDQIDIEIGGADDFQLTANTFTALVGSAIATDTINETTGAAGVTIDGVLLKDSIVTASSGLIAPTLKPAADSTTAVQIQTSGGVAVLNVNTTDSQVEITGNVKISAVLSLAGTAIDATKRLNLAVINSETASNPYGIYASMTQSAAAAKTMRSMYSEALGTHSSGTQTGLRAFDGLTSNNGAGIVTSLYGMYNFARNNASGTVTTMVGNLSIAQNVSTGPITNAYGIKTYVQNFGAATVDAAYLLHGYITQNNASSVITTAYGLAIADWTNAGTIGTSYGIYIGDISVGTQTNPPWSIYASDANAPSYFAGSVGVGATAPDTLVHALLTDAGTDAVVNVLTVGHDSSGTPAVGFGAGIHLTLESNTTAKQSAARIIAETVVATHASRTYRLRGTAFDAAGEREGWRVEADGTVARLGFYGVTAVVRPTALTTQLTTLTHTAPGTPDYALQNLVQNTGFGFVTADEGNSTLAVIANLQTRVGELESKLVSLGLLS